MLKRTRTKNRKSATQTQLRVRMAELEQTLRAIRGGKVDALVVNDQGGFQVYTLQGAEHPYRVLVESIGEGAATLDSEGSVLYANERLAKMLKVELQNLIGSPLQSYLPEGDRAQLQCSIESGKRAPTVFELSVGGGAAPRRVLRISFSPFQVPGQQLVCAVVSDLTELIEANEAQRESELKLQALSGQLMKLQDGERRHISRDLHDVSGQNLAVLNLTLSELERVSSHVSNPEMHTLLQRCRFLAEQVAHEIRTLSYVLHPPLLDEVGLPSVAAWYANGFGQRTGVRVEIETSPDIVRLSQDAEIALFRVLQEGLANVHRHSESSCVSVHLSVEGGSVRLEIEDKGKGIPAEALKKQGAAPLGVGIQGMRERMRQLSGTLDIVSSQRGGTRVIATVPVHRHPFEQPAAPSESRTADYESSSGTSESVARRVLIADDHEMLREGIRRVLQQNRNWTVCGEAANGKEAVDRAVALKPDLVILDLSMPVLNGLEALKQIRMKCPDTKVLIFSVNNSEHVVREVRTAGAHGYLCKSNAAQDLLDTLKTLFEEESYAQASASGS